MEKFDIWEKEPHEDNYQRALRYLSLRLQSGDANRLVSDLRDAGVQWQLADDVLRAARLRSLPLTDAAFSDHIRGLIEDRHKMHPILVVRFGMRVEIADGYHALCVAQWLGPQVACPVVIAGP